MAKEHNQSGRTGVSERFLLAAMDRGIVGGLAVAFLGVLLVWLGEKGDTIVEWPGGRLVSSSVGVAVLFFGAWIVAMAVRYSFKAVLMQIDRDARERASVDESGARSSGRLKGAADAPGAPAEKKGSTNRRAALPEQRKAGRKAARSSRHNRGQGAVGGERESVGGPARDIAP